MSERLHKYLAGLGIASRRQAEAWIKEGRLKVNGKLATVGIQIEPGQDKILLDGKSLRDDAPPNVYWMLHKPDKTLTSKVSQDDKATIFDLPSLAKVRFQVNPVGRLDYRSEGLLLLTNDGQLAYRLTHPRFKVQKQYYVLVNGKLSKEQKDKLKKGVTLEDGPVRKFLVQAAHGQKLGKTKGTWYIVTVEEGRNRLIRRVFALFDLKVVRLVRFAMGDLTLPDNLPPGEYRQLSKKQIASLRKVTGLDGRAT